MLEFGNQRRRAQRGASGNPPRKSVSSSHLSSSHLSSPRLSSSQPPTASRSANSGGNPGAEARRSGKSARSPLQRLLGRLLGNPPTNSRSTRRESLAQRSSPQAPAASSPIQPIAPTLTKPRTSAPPPAIVTPFRSRPETPRRLQQAPKGAQREAQKEAQRDIQREIQPRMIPSNVVPLPNRRSAAKPSLLQRSSNLGDRQTQLPAPPSQSPTSPAASPSESPELLRRSRRPSQPKQPPKRVSPWVYAMRLLIVGIGVGAIAGTTLSLLEPSMRNQPPVRNPRVVSAAIGGEATLRNNQTVTLTANREMTDLSNKLAAVARGQTDFLPGVFVADLTRGEYATLNGGNVFSAASMIKMPILIAFFQEVDAGTIRLDEVLTIQQDDIAEGSGDMQHLPVGTQFSALETATQMIVTSDNTATNMIIRRLGGIEKVNQHFKRWGLQQTLLRDRLPNLNGTNTTSPKELVSLMATVTQGGLLTMTSRDRVITIMRGTLNDALLRQSIGEGALIAHKTGDIGAMLGDTGIVDLPNGKRYLIAVMVKRPINDDRAFELIQRLGREAYQHFAPMQPVTAPPAQATPNTTAPTPAQ